MKWLKYYLTFLIFLSSSILGTHRGIIGLVLPGLVIKLNSSITSVSYCFVTQGIGMFLGSIFSSIIYRKIGIVHGLMMILFFQGFVNFVLGLSAHLLLFCTVYFFQGFIMGFIFPGMFLLVNDVWGKDDGAAVFQGISAGAALGRIIEPLIVSPFLPGGLDDKIQNSTDSASNIGVPYYIVGVYSFLIGIGYAIPLLLKLKYERQDQEDESAEKAFFSKNKFSKKIGFTLLLVGTLQLFMMRGTLAAISNLLLKYLSMIPNGANLQKGSIFLTVWAIVLFISRLTLGVVTKVIGTTGTILLMLTIYAVGSFLLLFKNMSYWIPWITIAVGIAGQQYGNMGWLKQHLGVTSNGVAFILSWSDLGFLVQPYIAAQLIGRLGTDSFKYVLIVLAIIMMILFIVMTMLTLCKDKKEEKEPNGYGTVKETLVSQDRKNLDDPIFDPLN